jgi:hypothetical protein
MEEISDLVKAFILASFETVDHILLVSSGQLGKSVERYISHFSAPSAA